MVTYPRADHFFHKEEEFGADKNGHYGQRDRAKKEKGLMDMDNSVVITGGKEV